MSKQIKGLLKLTKQLIQEKKYDEALQQCKDILSLDEENYNGLVFMGLCLAELHEKEKSRDVYHDAIKLQKDQYLAYQGLLNLYTKHWVAKLKQDDTTDLIMAYEHLIDLIGSKEKKKKSELELGLAKAYCSNEKFSKCLAILEEMTKQATQFENGDGDMKPNLDSYYDEVVVCLKQAKNDYASLFNYSHLFCETVKYLFTNKNEVFIMEEMLKLLIVFHQSSEETKSEGLQTIISIVRWFISNQCKSSFLTHCAIEIYLQDASSNSIDEETLNMYLESLSDCEDCFRRAHQGHTAFLDNQYESCVDRLIPVIKNYPDYLPARLEIAQSYLKLHKWDCAEIEARSGLQGCKRLINSKVTVDSTWLIRIAPISTIKLEFSLVFAKALCESENKDMLRLSIGTFEQLSKLWPDSIEVRMGIAKAYVNMKDYQSALPALDVVETLEPGNLEAISWKAFIKFEQGDKETSIKVLQDIIATHQSCFIAHFLLAKMMWHSEPSLQDKAFTIFLKAAKSNIYHGPTFYYIGLYYRDVVGNQAKATRCFEKAYNLGPKSRETGSALADQYVLEGNLSAAITLYESVTNVAPAGTCKWAWLRLGLCRLKNNDIESAIRCLHAALRCDSDDYISWECLGEAYLQRGSYTSAWKAFDRAHQLEPNSVYSLYQMAAIKQVLGQFDEAVKEYEGVLKLSSNYVPALKGLGESHLSLAKTMMSEGRYMTCIDHINDAIKYLADAVAPKSDLSCVWKLLGDCMTIIHPLDGSKVSIIVPSWLLGKEKKSPEESEVTKIEALRLGGKFYAQALRLHNSALLWHDFALNCFHQAQESEEEDETLAAKSLQMLQKGLSIEPTNHVLWNSLGAIAASKFIKNFALAQHSFIRSIQCEPNNVAAWSNLGSFYLERSQIELAHKAFKNAQSLEPSFVNSWIGQAIIAESIGRDEAMDLFRHATVLDLHGQAGAGYGSWVCNLISECRSNRQQSKYKDNIHDLHAISAATLQLSKFCDAQPNSEWAFAMYGFLLEESGLNRSAEVSYKQCLELLELQMETCNGEDTSALTTKIERAKKDYARVLFKNGHYQASVEVYQSIVNLSDYNALCGFAIGLRANGMVDEAYAALNQASEAATTQRQCNLVAMAMAVTLWQCGDTEKAVEILLRHKSNSFEALLCLCAIGVVEKDLDLVQSLVNDINNYDVIGGRYDVIFHHCLIISAAVAMVSSKKAVSFLQKCIHKNPDDFRLRHLLSLTLASAGFHQLACQCAEQSKLNYHTDPRSLSTEAHQYGLTPQSCIQQHKDVMANYASALLANGKHHNLSFKADSLKNAQRFVHCHPQSAKSWALLSSACYAKTVLTRYISNENSPLRLLAQRLSKHVVDQSNADLHAWAVEKNLLSSSLNRDSDDPVKVPPKVAYSTLFQSGQYKQAFKSLSKLRSDATAAHHRAKTSLQMAFVALRAAKLEPNKSADWLNKTRDALVDAGRSPIAQLLQGLLLKQLKNYKKACTYLMKVFDSSSIPASCQSRSVAAWYLYVIYHLKDDDMMMEKLLEKWKKYSDPFMEKVTTLLACT